ncbi:MAG TPA: hypothetical protein VMM15_40965 [Bradyrhizobium sp.]|nr:hypothetical protein [Bradyrhizobium sp.]
MESNRSPLELQAADALRRARRLPVGAERNDLRQLATGLLWLHRRGMEALVENRRVVMTRELEHAEALEG